VTLHPRGSWGETPDDEQLEVAVPTGTPLTQLQFEEAIRTALVGTGFRRQGLILPGA
jgi:hypothetical protein